MAFGFWDAIILSTTMAAHDYFKEKEKQKERRANFYKKCNIEIA